MLAGLVIVPAVSIITKAPDKAVLTDIFSCYEETVSVKVRDDLGS
jgi:SSS family solute:Na+ symporter